IPRTIPCRAEARCARERSACRGRAAPRCACRPRRAWRRRAVPRGCPGCLSFQAFPVWFERVLTRPFPDGKPAFHTWTPSIRTPHRGKRDIEDTRGERAMTEAAANAITATEATPIATAGVVTGGLRLMLRLEGLGLFVGMTLLYAVWGGSWWLYLILFLVPDISFAAYLSGP